MIILTLMNAAILQLRPCPAQEARLFQEISGTVKDATGGVLPGAAVAIPALRISVNADNAGRYTLKNVPPGKAVLEVSLSGFADRKVEVLVTAGENLTLDIVLEIQSRSETITVEYASPKLMTASDSIGVVSVAPSQVAALPSLGEKDIFRAFQLSRGYSPLAFAKQVRLRHARCILNLADATTTVTNVAFACGFSDLGHFSKDYRRMFGELPSQALCRAKGVSSANH